MANDTMLKKHPLNVDFEWQQPQPPYRIITEAQAQAYRETGGFILEDAFSLDDLAPVTRELDELERSANAGLKDIDPQQPTIARHDEIVFSAHAVTSSKAARAFSAHPTLVGLCEDLIGGEVRLYWDQLVYKRPGTEDEFPWHQDNGYSYVEPQQYLTCWIALTDATIENGCPWIAPGLHQHGTLMHKWTDIGFNCMATPDDAMPMPLRAGSVAVFSSLTPHRTGPNLTQDVRKAYILQYAPEGARVIPRQGDAVPANDPARQYRVN